MRRILIQTLAVVGFLSLLVTPKVDFGRCPSIERLPALDIEGEYGPFVGTGSDQLIYEHQFAFLDRGFLKAQSMF